MKVMIVESAGVGSAFCGHTPRKLRSLFRRDNIPCSLVPAVAVHAPKTEPNVQNGPKPSPIAHLKKAARDRTVRRFAQTADRGDAILLMDPSCLDSDVAVLELARTGRYRLVAVARDRFGVERCLSSHILGRYLTTLIVPDPELKTLAHQRFRDVRIVPGTAGGSASVSVEQIYEALRRAIYPVVTIYGIFYRYIDIFEKTLAGLSAHTDLDYRLFVAENHAEESARNREIIRRYMEQGLVHGYALFSENIYGSAMEYLYHLFPPALDEEIIVFTDLDLVIPARDRDWLRRMLDKFQRYEEVAELSLDIDLCNWNRERAGGHKPIKKKHWSGKYGIYRFRSGVWFMAVRRQMMDEYLDGTRVFADNRYFRYLDSMYRNQVYGRLPVSCYHLSWDLEQTAPAYIEKKYEDFYTRVYERHPCPPFEVCRIGSDGKVHGEYVESPSEILALRSTGAQRYG